MLCPKGQRSEGFWIGKNLGFRTRSNMKKKQIPAQSHVSAWHCAGHGPNFGRFPQRAQHCTMLFVGKMTLTSCL
jgi:hypothetical protein